MQLNLTPLSYKISILPMIIGCFLYVFEAPAEDYAGKNTERTFAQNESLEDLPELADEELPELADEELPELEEDLEDVSENQGGPFEDEADLGQASGKLLNSQIPPNAQLVTEDTNLPEELLVEVEPSNIIPVDLTGGFYMVPYRVRRTKWGATYGISYSTYSPDNYEPNNVTGNFDDVYTSADVPLLELHMNIKRNFSWASLGLDLGAGSYQNGSDTDLIAANLKLTLLRVGATLTLDCFWLEPYFAPYASGGIYTMLFNETSNATSYNGNTGITPYITIGALIQLDWIDRLAARDAYQESGLENTFLFLEGRMLMTSPAEGDPDFSAVSANAGFKVEM